MSNSDGSLEYGNEYCLVNNIQIHLGDLLDRITLDKHVKPIVTRQCIVNLDTRYQLAHLRNDINEAEKVRKVKNSKKIDNVAEHLCILSFLLRICVIA